MKNISCGNNTYHIFFRNLSNPIKIKIITELKDGACAVGEICKKTGLEQSKVSHALASMKHCNIVDCAQEGKKRIYSLNKTTIVPMLKLIDQHKCKFCPERR